jgi:hypothetical protein
MSAGLSPKYGKNKIKIKIKSIYFYFYFYFSFSFTCWAQAAPRHSVRSPEKKKKKNNFLFFIFLAGDPCSVPRGRLRPASGKKNKNKNKILFFFFFPQATPAERRRAACTHHREEKKQKKIPSFGLNPADVRGVKPWEPPHLLPPNSYLLPLLLYKTPHESYFSLFLCSHVW